MGIIKFILLNAMHEVKNDAILPKEYLLKNNLKNLLKCLVILISKKGFKYYYKPGIDTINSACKRNIAVN